MRVQNSTSQYGVLTALVIKKSTQELDEGQMSVSITVTNKQDRDRSDINNSSPRGDNAVLLKKLSVSLSFSLCVCARERELVCV